MIIESHSHVKASFPDMDTPVTGTYGKSVEGIDQYIKTYDECGIDKCWVFGTYGYRISELITRENEFLGKIKQKYEGRLFPWGTVNPFWENRKLRTEVKRLKDLKLYGIKLAPVAKGCSFASKEMDSLAKTAMDFNLPIFFHDGSAEYCSPVQVMYFARKHENLRIVSGHTGLRELWRDYLDAVDIPNLWFCLSGPTLWGMRKLYDKLGPDKLMFGSDGGLGTVNIVKAYLERINALKIPDEHKKMILGENALRFFE